MSSIDKTIRSTERGASFHALGTLLESLKAILPQLSGFRSLSLFGSLAEGRADGYSDIDLIVVTDDLACAKSELLGLLEQLGPVEFCWVMSPRPDEWIPTIVFRNEGYYHKVDLGLVESTTTNHSIPDKQTVLLVDTPCQSPTAQIRQSAAYTPAHGSVGHFLLSQFLGGTRYLKARKRGQEMVCYRFVVAAADWCARTLYARLTGNLSLRDKLSTDEYVVLDKLASDEQRSTLLEALDFSTPAAMDSAMCSLFSMLVEDTRTLAVSAKEALPSDIVARSLLFMQEELEPNT